MPESVSTDPGGGSTLPLMAAADLQDNLMTASNDLERLQRLLSDASEALLGHFYGASGQLNHLLHAMAKHPELNTRELHDAMQHMAGAITAMQFQDMASQLISHSRRRVASVADCLGNVAVGGEDGAEVQWVGRACPVAQRAVDAGSIELF